MKTKATKKRKRVASVPHLINEGDYSLAELLEIVDNLFPTYRTRATYTYNFALSKFPVEYGWYFNVINSWPKWLDKGFETHFGGYQKPESAVAAFLNYAWAKDISISKLVYKSQGCDKSHG